MQQKKCPGCGTRTIRPGRAELTRTVGGLTLTGEVEVERCDSCGEWSVGYAEGRRFDLAVALALVEHGVDAADAFKFMRKTTGLRASDLAALLGVTPETVSRWETGKVAVERRALALLQAIVTDHAAGVSTTLDRLRAMTGHRRRPPKTIRVALD
jgi:putative zinc finger/helix-turn-helix YgiT family protein